MPDGSREPAVMQRAYMVLDIKAVDEDQRIIEGVATTAATDRMSDVVEPKGAQFSLPLPLLMQHAATPDGSIGHVVDAKVTNAGIRIRAKVEKDPLLPELDRAWARIKKGLVRGLSIGFRPLEAEPMDPKDPFGGMRFKRWEWLELSAVVIPANAEASIQTIKSLGQRTPANAGTTARPVDTPLPGRSGYSKGLAMRTPQVLLAELGQEKDEKSARMQSIYQKCEGDIEALEDQSERDEYDRLGAEVRNIAKQMERQQAMLTAISGAASAVPVTMSAGTDPREARRVRHGDAQEKPRTPPGTTFARAVIAKAVGRGSLADALQIAKQRWPDDHLLRDYLQKANAGTTVSGNWADDLAQTRIVDNEFIELLRPATILGRLQGTRSADFNTSYISQTSGSTVAWVGEAAAKPVGELAFSSVSIPIAKCAGIVVLSEEQIMVSRPNSEDVVRQDLVAQVAQFLDEQFIDPSVSAVANTNPASITNGAPNFGAGGATADDLRADLYQLFGLFANSNMGVAGLTLIMTSNLAMGLALLTNSLGQPEFPGMTLEGGTLLGMRVIVSDNVPGSSSSGLIVAVKPSEIYIADAGGVRVDVSREATLDMAGGNTPAFSLWQKNCVGLRAERFISWAKRRSNAVAYISGAGYMPTNP